MRSDGAIIGGPAYLDSALHIGRRYTINHAGNDCAPVVIRIAERAGEHNQDWRCLFQREGVCHLGY